MEEYEEENDDSNSTKDWLAPTSSFLSQLKDVKKSYYRLGGGPREREVDCRCNYRTQKNSSHFLTLEPEPPQLLAVSQETASTDIKVSDLVQQCQKHVADNKPTVIKRQRPQSSSIGQRHVPVKETENGETSSGGFNRVFIAVKGQTVKPQSRPDSASKPSGTGLGVIDDQSIESVQQATLDDLVKFSAAFADSQQNEPLPPPPCSSPDLMEQIQDESYNSEGDIDVDNSKAFSPRQRNGGINHASGHVGGNDLSNGYSSSLLQDLEDKPELMENTNLLQNQEGRRVPMVIPKASNMVFSIPTGDDDSDEKFSEDELSDGVQQNDMPLGESLEKADSFMNTLNQLKNVEKTQINKCVSNINKITLAMGTIDLTSVHGDDLDGSNNLNPGRPVSRLSMHRPRPSSSRLSSSDMKMLQQSESEEHTEIIVPNEDGNTEGVDIGVDEEGFGDNEIIENFAKYDREPMWVEEPSVPVIKVKTQGKLGFAGDQADVRKKKRPSSSKIIRRESDSKLDDGYLIQGKTIEFMDATDLLARRPMAYTKPVRPPSAPQPVTKRHSLNDMRPDPHRLDQNPGDMSVQVKIAGRPPKPTRPSSAWTSTRPKSGQRLRLSSGKKRSPVKQEEDDRTKKVHEKEKKEMQTLSEPLSAMTALSDPQAVLTGKGLKKTVSFENNLSGQLDIDQETKDPNVEGKENQIIPEPDESKKINNSDNQKVVSPEKPYIAIQDGVEVANAKDMIFSSTNTTRGHVKRSTEVISQVGDFCREITRPTMTVIGHGQDMQGGEGQVSPRHLKKRVNSANSLYSKHQRQPTSPRPVIKRHTTTSARKLRAKSASVLGRDTNQLANKAARPQSALSRQEFRDFEPLNRPFPPFPAYKEKRKGKSKKDGTVEVIEIRHTDDELIVAPSEECENVYSKFKEKGMDIPMETITKGLMAPARKAPATTQNQGLPISSTSSLLSHPQVWLAKEFKKLKKAEKALREAEVMLAHQAEAKARARARTMKVQMGEDTNNDVIKTRKKTRRKSKK